MLKKADVDAVEILTPVFAHHSIAVDAINAGKHVLVEKPFSVSVKAGWRILEAAEKQGVVLGIADALHYREDARMTKWAIDQGYIGRPQVYIYARGAGYWDPDKIVAETPWRHIKIYAGAGITADWLAHRSHLLNLYYRKISEVSAHVDILSPRRKTVDETGKVVKEVDCNVDDTVLAILKHESGTLGFLFASWSLHGVTLNEDRVYGSKGCLVGDKLVSEGKGEVSLRELFNREAKQSLKEKFFPKGITNHFALEILEFLSAIKEKREMETSGKDGLREVAVAYAMIESSRRGRAVYVDDVLNGKICDYEMEINRYYEI
jgi:predicted dehydrogenase